MEEYSGYSEEEQTLDAMLLKMVEDGIISMTWDEVDGLVYFMTDEQKQGIRVLYHSWWKYVQTILSGYVIGRWWEPSESANNPP